MALISDYINQKFTGTSFLTNVLHKSKPRLYFFIIGTLAGLILDAVATYFGALWYYPFYSTGKYLAIVFLFGGFAWYFLCIILSYEAFKDLLDYFFPFKKIITKSYKYENNFYESFLVIGVFGLSLLLGKILWSSNILQSFVFNINQLKKPYISFYEIILIFVCLFLIFEFVEFKKKRVSLLKDLFHGYFNPLLAIIIVSFVLGLYMELQNLPLKLWIYSNWPNSEWKFFGIPTVVFLIGWPIHYIFFLSMYRALGDEQTTKPFWSILKFKNKKFL